MFIREVVKKNKGYRKKFVYHFLVESYRTAKGPRQRTLLKLGVLTLPKERWKALSNRIEELYLGQSSLLPPADSEIESLAQHYSSLLAENQLERQSRDASAEKETVYEEVDLNSISTSFCRDIGAEHVSLSILRRLGFDRLLGELGLSNKEKAVAQLLIVGRLVCPASEWRTWQWATERSAIGELLRVALDRLSHNVLYKVGDLLYAHKSEIERRLYQAEKTLFSFSEQIVLYDLTNVFFEGEIGQSKLKRRGRSKQKRSDAPLVTLGLVLNECGFPRKSEVFSGNVSEPETLRTVLSGLADASGGGGKTVVLDAGIATKANLEMLKSEGYDYVVVARQKPPEEAFAGGDEGFFTIKHTQDNKVEARLYRQEDEVWVMCRSLKRRLKEQAMRTLLQKRFETGLKGVLQSLHKKGGTKKYDKVLERIGRLKQKYARVAHYYEVSVEKKKGYATDVRWHVRKGVDTKLDDRFSGQYYLRSSRTDLGEKELWSLYITLTDVEDSFRSMKSELGIRPNYHHKDERIAAHLFITVLAHHVVNSIQWLLHQKEIYMRWERIRFLLATQQRVTTSFENREARKIWIRTTSEPESFHRLIANALNIEAKPLKQTKIVY